MNEERKKTVAQFIVFVKVVYALFKIFGFVDRNRKLSSQTFLHQ